ncbi:MAG: ornithine cyclodeaminase family protein [Promethearchaeota archaeon Loki_b32]|nr:MAG: ornithine cyclodeaminase family protein [Candidatus Lokiarchaeota archaeon Loki_b32]
MVRILTKENVTQLLTMPDALEYVEEAYKQLSLGNALVPQRIAITDPAPGLTLIMPGIIGGEMNALATKIVSVYKQNPDRYNMPTVLAKVMVQDINTGDIVGIMDGSLITAMRTGAATGVSVKYLARKNSTTMGIYSAGVQARKQVSAVFWGLNEKLEKCKVYDLKKEVADGFKKELENELGIEIEIVNSGDDLLTDTDIIVAATTSTTPLFSGDKVSEGTHISSIGAHAPEARELDSVIIKRASLLTAGLKEACLAEAGDYIIPINEGVIRENDIISIGGIINGNISGRTSDSEITIFKSVGISAQDVAVGKLVYDRALKDGIGQDIDF